MREVDVNRADTLLGETLLGAAAANGRLLNNMNVDTVIMTNEVPIRLGFFFGIFANFVLFVLCVVCVCLITLNCGHECVSGLCAWYSLYSNPAYSIMTDCFSLKYPQKKVIIMKNN